MESTGITPVMPMGDSFSGGNSFMWIFGLLILLGLFNGNGLWYDLHIRPTKAFTR